MRGRTAGCSGGRGQVSSEAAAAAPLTMELPPSPSTGDQAQARRSSVKRCLSPALASTTSCRPPANKRKVTDPGLLLVQVHTRTEDTLYYYGYGLWVSLNSH